MNKRIYCQGELTGVDPDLPIRCAVVQEETGSFIHALRVDDLEPYGLFFRGRIVTYQGFEDLRDLPVFEIDDERWVIVSVLHSIDEIKRDLQPTTKMLREAKKIWIHANKVRGLKIWVETASKFEEHELIHWIYDSGSDLIQDEVTLDWMKQLPTRWLMLAQERLELSSGPKDPVARTTRLVDFFEFFVLNTVLSNAIKQRLKCPLKGMKQQPSERIGPLPVEVVFRAGIVFAALQKSPTIKSLEEFLNLNAFN